MSENEHEQELAEPSVTDTPEPDQDERDEADEAEAEAAETHDAEPEPEPEPEGATQEVWEARFKYAERLFSTYSGKVTDKWEEDALTLVAFNLDAAAPPGFIDMRNKGHVDDDTKAAALAFLGFDQEAGMEDDPYSYLCETCNGWGLVKTGSRVPNQDVRGCDDCRGVGYVMKDAVKVTTLTPPNGAASIEGGQLVPAATGVESPEVESLRLRGYTIIPPMRTES